MLKLLTLIFLVNLAHPGNSAGTANLALDGNSVGNGGDVVICPQSYELLDIYEAKELYKRNLITSNEDHKVIIKERLSILGTLSSNLEALYLKKINAYKIGFKNEIALKNLKDENHVFIPKNCSLKQIAHRINEASPTYDIIINDNVRKQHPPLVA